MTAELRRMTCYKVNPLSSSKVAALSISLVLNESSLFLLRRTLMLLNVRRWNGTLPGYKMLLLLLGCVGMSGGPWWSTGTTSSGRTWWWELRVDG